MTQKKFIKWINFYLKQRARMNDDKYARIILLEFLTNEGIKFGDPAYSWDTQAASDLVDIEISYWDAD